MGSCRASQEKGGSPMEMEASNSRGRGGEARRVNVVYFLSRNGRVEHPHLLRVHRLHRDRVHLRDVKQWLLEFRGSQVSNSFSWSYKRRYRGGYVWQDLRDDDLITPFSDNEYILKGSNDLLTLNPLCTHSKLTMPAETHEKPAIVGEALPPSAMLPPPPEQAGEISSDEAKHGEDGKQQRRKEEDDEDTKAASLVSDSNNCSKRVGQVLCNILGCKTAAAAETADDALRPVSHR